MPPSIAGRNSPQPRQPASLPGRPQPFGATVTPRGINFALFSRHAATVALLLFDLKGNTIGEYRLDPIINKTGDIWHILLKTGKRRFQYAYRVTGPHDPDRTGHFFDPRYQLLDPYARALAGGETWSAAASGGTGFERRCLVPENRFDWEGDRPLNLPLEDTVIYELHVRGFTRHPSSGVEHPGTFRGIIEKIPYLKKLGITAVELMPVTDFNERENINHDPETGEPLVNFWGYSPISFFAPKAAYAAEPEEGGAVREFKAMVKALHRAGIEVILDVVFNHTAEGMKNGPVLSFRGLDNTIYYLLEPDTGRYLNFSGCGNTLNCNHPLVRQLIIDCLHYWVVEMHVDGFRFDLASILGRDRNGEVLRNPPMVEMIAEDPVLAQTKIMAEAWDAAGLYQVGSFSTSARWAEWNGHFRDDVRAFMCGRENTVPALATRIAGSSDLYRRGSHRPTNSINFITCHDGFTLYDLVSYDRKHNHNNGENNRDGLNDNISWNSGVEGDTKNRRIRALRFRRIRTLAAILFLSQGVPLLPAGDEFGRSQGGNNNAYCHDSEISWLDWRLTRRNRHLLRFFRMLIHLRRRHPVFRRTSFFPDPGRDKAPEAVGWQGTEQGRPDWSPAAKVLAFHLHGSRSPTPDDNDFFVMLNGHRRKRTTFKVPPAPAGKCWRRIINTAAAPPADIVSEPEGTPLPEPARVTVPAMTAVALIAM